MRMAVVMFVPVLMAVVMMAVAMFVILRVTAYLHVTATESASAFFAHINSSLIRHLSEP
jgi:hypothetical protein